MPLTLEWRGTLSDGELDRLHDQGFAHPPTGMGRSAQLNRHSLGSVCARDQAGLVGFVKVAWDGGVHAFLLDTLATCRAQRQGVGTARVVRAVEKARAAGCEWLPVDFDEGLGPFYLQACGFAPTPAGLLRL